MTIRKISRGRMAMPTGCIVGGQAVLAFSGKFASPLDVSPTQAEGFDPGFAAAGEMYLRLLPEPNSAYVNTMVQTRGSVTTSAGFQQETLTCPTECATAKSVPHQAPCLEPDRGFLSTVSELCSRTSKKYATEFDNYLGGKLMAAKWGKCPVEKGEESYRSFMRLMESRGETEKAMDSSFSPSTKPEDFCSLEKAQGRTKALLTTLERWFRYESQLGNSQSLLTKAVGTGCWSEVKRIFPLYIRKLKHWAAKAPADIELWKSYVEAASAKSRWHSTRHFTRRMLDYCEGHAIPNDGKEAPSIVLTQLALMCGRGADKDLKKDLTAVGVDPSASKSWFKVDCEQKISENIMLAAFASVSCPRQFSDEGPWSVAREAWREGELHSDCKPIRLSHGIQRLARRSAMYWLLNKPTSPSAFGHALMAMTDFGKQRIRLVEQTPFKNWDPSSRSSTSIDDFFSCFKLDLGRNIDPQDQTVREQVLVASILGESDKKMITSALMKSNNAVGRAFGGVARSLHKYMTVKDKKGAAVGHVRMAMKALQGDTWSIGQIERILVERGVQAGNDPLVVHKKLRKIKNDPERAAFQLLAWTNEFSRLGCTMEFAGVVPDMAFILGRLERTTPSPADITISPIIDQTVLPPVLQGSPGSPSSYLHPSPQSESPVSGQAGQQSTKVDDGMPWLMSTYLPHTDPHCGSRLLVEPD